MKWCSVEPDAVESEVSGDFGEAEVLFPHPGVGAVFPAVAGKEHHHTYVHLVAPFLSFGVSAGFVSELTEGYRYLNRVGEGRRSIF